MAVLQQNGAAPLALVQIDIEVPGEVVARDGVAGVRVVDDARAALHGEEVRGDLASVAAGGEELDGAEAEAGLVGEGEQRGARVGPVGGSRLVRDGEELPPGGGGQRAVALVVGRRGEDDPVGGAEVGERGGGEPRERRYAGPEDGRVRDAAGGGGGAAERGRGGPAVEEEEEEEGGRRERHEEEVDGAPGAGGGDGGGGRRHLGAAEGRSSRWLGGAGW